MSIAPLTAAALLAAWDRGAAQHPLDRALSLLQAATPDAASAALARLPLGERDRRLWELRAATFGPRLEALAVCPACGAAIEFDLRVSEILDNFSPTEESRENPPTAWREGDWCLTYRLPDSWDLAAVAHPGSLAPTAVLAGRIIERAAEGDAKRLPGTLPTEILAAFERHLATVDPLADLQLDLSCPDCAHAWPEPFDIASFLWEEVVVEARRLLGEVSVLARAFGWSEAAILALSPTRRAAYLEAIDA
ncbi:MAG: hypothetical protein ACLFR7_05755 [Opitutales bacterium]